MKTASPKGGKKGCLCKDGKTYNPECCTGELQAQGVGRLVNPDRVIEVVNENQERTLTHN